jgi:broad specificity phosphatase PhoE
MTRTITLYFVRHGQADHNIAADLFGEYAYWDKLYTNAKLTEKGIIQATNLNNYFKKNNPDIVFSSPLKRCLQTLDYALIDYNHDVYVDDRLVERLGEHPCNMRANKDEVITHINRKLNTEYVKDGLYWMNKRELNSDIEKRGIEWYNYMLDMINKNENINSVAIFSHYEFLNTILNNHVLPISSIENGKPFDNCEVRKIKINI